MKKKNVLVAGILGLLLVLGAAVALAQNTGEKTKDAENHECTPQMMENMPENCPEQMTQSGACDNMLKDAKGCDEMMGSTSPAGNAKREETDHCTGTGSGMDSMMGSGGADKRGMM